MYHHRRPRCATHGRPRCATLVIVSRAVPSGDSTSRDASPPPAPTTRRQSAPASPPSVRLSLPASLPPPSPGSARRSPLTAAVSAGLLVPGRSSALAHLSVDTPPNTA